MSRLSTPSFDIGRSRQRCAVSGAAFRPGDPVVAALFENMEADGVLHRLDFSPAGWERFRAGEAVVVEHAEQAQPSGPVAADSGAEAEVANDGDGSGSSQPAQAIAWATPERLFASWKTTAAEPGQRKTMLDEGSMLEIFESLEGTTDEAQLAFRFVLALVLIRRKMLVHAGAVPASQDGGDALLLVRAKGDPIEVPPMEVVQPALTPERIAAVTSRIEQLLQSGGR
jgi:hypothetical protein